MGTHLTPGPVSGADHPLRAAGKVALGVGMAAPNSPGESPVPSRLAGPIMSRLPSPVSARTAFC